MSEINRQLALNSIEKKKTKTDYVHDDGIVYGHILTSDLKSTLKEIGTQIRKLLPGINFRILKEQKKFGDNPYIYDLYGDYYKFWEVVGPKITTKVVDLHKVNGERPSFDEYIGRRVPYTEFTEDSIWHNPYSYKKYGDKCLDLFEEYLRNNIPLLRKLPALKGKVLGCWCKNQRDGRCHGDIIIKIMIERGIFNEFGN